MAIKDQPQYLKLLTSVLPGPGKSSGNKSLMDRFNKRLQEDRLPSVTKEEYFELRNALVQLGMVIKGQGKGGSVIRVKADEPEEEIPSGSKGESKLYEPFIKTLASSWAKDYEIPKLIVQNTSTQGKRQTGGKWTRPDVALVAMYNYRFLPGKRLEAITFEIKPKGILDVQAVFEAASHSAFAHRSVLAVEIPTDSEWSDVPLAARVESECARFRVGLIAFEDPSDYDTWQTIHEAPLLSPDPSEVDKFIATQLSRVHQDEIANWAD